MFLLNVHWKGKTTNRVNKKGERKKHKSVKLKNCLQIKSSVIIMMMMGEGIKT